MKSSIFLILSLGLSFTSNCLASTGGAEQHGFDHHAQQVFIYQCINVGIIIVGLIYFLRTPVKAMFAQKKTDYLAAAEKSKEAFVKAEEEHLKIQIQLKELESTSDESLRKAKIEAAELKKNLIKEATTTADRIKKDTEVLVKLEVDKAQLKIRNQLIQEAFVLADQKARASITNDDHLRLNTEFITHINEAKT